MEREVAVQQVPEAEAAGGAEAAQGAGTATRFTSTGPKPSVGGGFVDPRPSASQLAFDHAGGAPGAPTNDRDNPWKRPPEYAAMDPAIVDLLARSRDTYFNKDPKPFWDLVDAKLNARLLQALTQTIKGARALGLLGTIDKLHDVFNFGSSWGIEFTGALSPPAAGWGKDWPQDAVRNEHSFSKKSMHDWYRQDSGAGNPGMHMGVGPDGVHNLHWDPSNPMERVSDGTIHGSPLLAKMPGINDVVPAGHAIYGAKGLMQHEADIGKLDKYPRLKAMFATSRPPGAHTSTEPFYSLSMASENHAHHARELAKSESGRVAQMINKARGQLVVDTLNTRCDAIDALEKSSRALAMEERDGHEAAFDAVADKLTTLMGQLYDGLCALMHHLHDEVPGYPSNLAGYENSADWMALGIHVWKAQDTVWGLQAEREKRATGP